jgi:hypothetical protein
MASGQDLEESTTQSLGTTVDPPPNRTEFNELRTEILNIGRLLRDPSAIRNLLATPDHRSDNPRAPRRQNKKKIHFQDTSGWGAFQTPAAGRSRVRTPSESSSSSAAEEEVCQQDNQNQGSANNPGDAAVKRPKQSTRDPSVIFDQLKSELSELKQEGKIKPRELHELKVLFDIFELDNIRDVRDTINQRLSELYIASCRSWTEAKAFQRRDLDKLLGLPPPVQQIVVRSQPAAKSYTTGKKYSATKSKSTKSRAK